MKKIFKSRIFSFILGAVIFSGISVCAYSLSSNDISFTPENSNWQVSNVEEAVNDLYGNRYGDLTVYLGGSSMSTLMGIGRLNLNDYDNKYSYFKINSVASETPNYNGSCAVTIIHKTLGQDYSPEFNKQYEVNDYGLIFVKATSTTNNQWNNCLASITFYN